MTRKTDKNTKYEIRNTKYNGYRRGSAIILAIVLTTLLAIVGVIFLLSSRVDSFSTSSVGDNADLKYAVDTVVAQISQTLVYDSPGIAGSYYDYPDGNNLWLASLEPYQSGANYYWLQVSNIYGPLSFSNIQAQILPDYNNTFIPYTQADADGDGVSDSIWVQVPGKSSTKGKPVFAAVRIIDNGGMLNINTGLKFDPASSVGDKQSDINIMAFAMRDNTHTALGEKESRLQSYRCAAGDPLFYDSNVIWRYDSIFAPFTPFDISDELVLRYRYILNRDKYPTRIENLWTNAFNSGIRGLNMPSSDPDAWFLRASNVSVDPLFYNYNHIATTYNLDRVINPAGQKMFNVNLANSKDCVAVRDAINNALIAVGIDSVYDGNQIAANLIDYIDTDSNVTVIEKDVGFGPKYYFGFETPCIYISQITQSFFDNSVKKGKSYAVELYKPYTDDILPDNINNKWQLVTTRAPGPIPIVWPGNSPFFILLNQDSNVPLDINDINHADSNTVFSTNLIFDGGDIITLQREVNIMGTYSYITVDWVLVPNMDPPTGWMQTSNTSLAPHSIKRDITLHKCIRKIWESPTLGSLLPPALGSFSFRYFSPDSYQMQAHPANQPLKSIGEIGTLFRKNSRVIDSSDREATSRIDLAEPNIQGIFNYLTVIDPNNHGQPFYTQIKGRININTAPWFVLAQLPWLVNPSVSYADSVKLAQAIVAYRDKFTIAGGPDYYQGGSLTSRKDGMSSPYPVRESPGFASTAELLNVTQDIPAAQSSIPYYDIRHYGRDGVDLSSLPDITFSDKAHDDFEERDVIFERISNLITVRSDVFTAYILVRIGENGPQKRVIAILDRSQVTPTNPKVKIIAVQPVPDPR